jgi:hypothetical protein
MLDARAPRHLAGLTAFYDHAEPDRYYVTCDAPTLVRTPTPQLSLVLFRSLDRSRGFLQLEAQLAPPQTQLQEAREMLAAQSASVILTPPHWRRGHVHLAGWVESEVLAPIQLSLGAPSLAGHPHVVVAAQLDQQAAALAHACLRGDGLPTVLIFELETLGLAGPLEVEAEADLQAIHDRLTAEGALTTPYGRARIAATWESCARDNLIRVRVLDESGDVESQRSEAMRRVGEDLLSRMFSPFPPPERPALLNDTTVAPIELSFRLTMRREELATHSRWNFRERRAVVMKHYAAASLLDLLGEHDSSDHIRFVDGLDDAQEVMVRVEPELARLGLAAVEVQIAREHDDTVRQTLVLTDESPQGRFSSDDEMPLRYRVQARFDPTRTHCPDRGTQWMAIEGNFITVAARDLFGLKTLTVIATDSDLDWLAHIEVQANLPGQPPQSLLLDSQRRSADLIFTGAAGMPISVTSHWRGVEGEPTLSAPGVEVLDDVLLLDNPFAPPLLISVIPLLLGGVQSVTVELACAHEQFEHTRVLTFDAANRLPERVHLRRPAHSPASYRFRVTRTFEDGSVSQGTWQNSDDISLIVGAEGPVQQHAVEVFLVPGAVSLRGSLAVELSLEAGNHRSHELIDGERDRARLSLVAPEDAPPPSLRIREFLATGSVIETQMADPPKIVVLPPPLQPITA